MRNPYHRFNSGRVNFFLLAVITVILVGAVLKLTSSLLVPFTIALLLAVVSSPIVEYLEKFHIPRVISVLFVLLFIIAGIAFIGMVLYTSGRTLITLYPKYEARITEIYLWLARFFELPYDEHLSIFDNVWGQVGVRNRVRILTLTFSNAFFVLLKDAFMVAIFMIFLLAEASFFRKKLDLAFEGSQANKIIKISSDIMKQVSRYLFIKFILSVFNGVCVGVGLHVIGVEFAAVWGVIQFITNFIPNIGTVVVTLATAAFSIVQFWPNPLPILATILLVSIVNGVVGFYVDPKVMGDRLGLSPLVILVSLLVWGYLWDFAGLILAVPMMAIIKIVCENIPVLEPISILLGSRRAAMAVRSGEASPPGDASEARTE